jgi:glutamate--cysteine ligase
LLDRIGAVAALLDAQRPGTDDVHAQALALQRARLHDPELTPSAQVLAVLRANGGSFPDFALQQSSAHAADFRARPLNSEEQTWFTALAQTSLAEQEQMERTQSGDFDPFITDYRSRTPSQLCDERQ